jgi:galactokinase
MPNRELFASLYDRAPEAVARAPGRVNLIGEHTDYNRGVVMPIATPQFTEVAIAARDDRRVRLWSANIGARGESAEYELHQERPRREWTDYVAGVTLALRERHYDISGFDAAVASSVPLGAGLSSSASLEIAMLRAIDARFSLGLAPMAIATLAHRAETSFVGAPVGLMDQMAVSMAGVDAALFIDLDSMSYESLSLPLSTALIVIDSGVTHHHASGGYRTRRAECDEAARRLGVASLRQIPSDGLVERSLPSPLDRRVRHVLTENSRVLKARIALKADDAVGFGRLMNESHASLRDDFEVSVADVDRLVGLAQSTTAVLGARMTGGGFGGSIVALASAAGVRQAAATILDAYHATGSTRGRLLIP